MPLMGDASRFSILKIQDDTSSDENDFLSPKNQKRSSTKKPAIATSNAGRTKKSKKNKSKVSEILYQVLAIRVLDTVYKSLCQI